MDLSQKSITADSRSFHQPVRLSSYQWQVDVFLPKSDLESDFGIGLLIDFNNSLFFPFINTFNNYKNLIAFPKHFVPHDRFLVIFLVVDTSSNIALTLWPSG